MSLITQTNGPTSNTFYWGTNASGGGGGGSSVPSIVGRSVAYWTQQTFIPTSGNDQSIRVEVGGTDTSNGNVLIPSAIRTALANSNYNTLRIDGTLPIYEDQGDFAGIGNYFQTTLTAAATDVGSYSYPATQFHPIISTSGSGIIADSGLLLANSCFSYPFSLVLSKTNSNITISSAAVTFTLESTSSSNAKFYIGSAVASSANAAPFTFTLSP